MSGGHGNGRVRRKQPGNVRYGYQLDDRTLQINGKLFTPWARDWGRGAKQRLHNRGEQLKRQGRIDRFRVKKYTSVKVRRDGDGSYVSRTVYVLYVHTAR
jgi:hypothetical protein